MKKDELIAKSGSSHLEKLFSEALWTAGWRGTSDPDYLRAELGDHHSFGWTSPEGHLRCEALPQARVEIGGAPYIVDFLFVTHAYDRLYIELDGHKYHERTPEQASRDRAFDRAAQLEGGVVLRFTHRELTRYMAQCIAELHRAIANSDRKLRIEEAVHGELQTYRAQAKRHGLPAAKRWIEIMERLG